MSPPRLTLLYSALALALFAVLAYSAVSTKSPTYDEPEHALTSYVALVHGDLRAEPDHPPLWKYWNALPAVVAGPGVNPRLDGNPFFRAIPDNLEMVLPWTVLTLYHTPHNDPDRLVASGRVMMLVLGVGLGAVVALFAYRAAGAVAACVAVTLFALDPNFLAHAPLVKNDVAIALCFTALAYALYRAGQALTWGRAAAVVLLCAACVTTKLTGVLAAPIVVLSLVVRALFPEPWPAFRWTLVSRSRRALAALGVCVACALVTYVAIWGVYLFRFDPSPDPAVHFNTKAILDREAYATSAARAAGEHRPLSRADLAAWTPGPFVRTTLFAIDHHLLPEPFLVGLLYAHASTAYRYAYALDEVYAGSRWYYFPLTVLTKTPIATLAAILLAALIPVFFRRPAFDRQWRWFVICLAVPTLVLVYSITTSGINIGLRHLLPLYPFLFVAIGVAAARGLALVRKVTRPVLAVLVLALAAETFLAYPNYIPFFNVAAGGYRGGYHLLGDSNLDWGQDLPLLAEWQRKHPDRDLHLAYFGLADPAHYGIRYHNLPNGYMFGSELPAKALPTSGVLAVSATILQGLYSPGANDHTYDALRARTPTEILGGSIYLFDLDAPQ